MSPERCAGGAAGERDQGPHPWRGIVCVFAEPEFTPRLVETLVEGTSAKSGVLDPEGATLLILAPSLYCALICKSLGDGLASCLWGPLRRGTNTAMRLFNGYGLR